MSQSNVVKCENLICEKCGHEYRICMPDDTTKISRIIRMQSEKKLCDKCFSEWYKQNGGDTQ